LIEPHRRTTELSRRAHVAPAPRLSPWGKAKGPWRDGLLRRLLAFADAGAVMLASVSLAVFSRDVDIAFWAAVFLPVWLLLAKLHGLYDRDHRTLRHLTVDELPGILMWSLSGTAATALLLVVTPAPAISIATAAQLGVVAAAAAFALRASVRSLWRRTVPRERALIVGNGPLADATRRKLELFPDIHIDVVDERDAFDLADLQNGGTGLADLERVILASHTIDEQLIAELVAACRREQVKLSVVPPARGMFGTAVRLNHVAELPLVEYNTWDRARATLFLKRAMDVFVSLTALVLLAPLLALIALAIKLDSRGPILFVQRRAGLYGRSFRMYKFRTMVADAERLLPELVPFDKLEDPMFKLRGDPRVTRVGRVLRRFSLDEIPQLFNVLKGDMSLVGPRPEQVELVERYAPEHRFRVAVKPGVTGPMQVYGRGELSFQERLAVEREYIENLSLRRDLHILALTIPTVFRGGGAY
jgi:exopolysaccharide biosynthesis polyprenyl glycosylphosphotransferase